jgi:hypothetical protein
MPHPEIKVGFLGTNKEKYNEMKKRFALTLVDVMSNKTSVQIFNSQVKAVAEFNKKMQRHNLDSYSEIGEDSIMSIALDGSFTMILAPIDEE